MSDVFPVVVAYSTDDAHPGAKRWRESCHRWGWSIYAINRGWPGWGGRLKAVLSFADDARRDGYTHLVHTDMWDVVCTGPPSELGPALDFHGRPPLLLAAEAGCWPDGHLAEQYEPRLSNWWYPHSQFVLDLTQPAPPGFGVLNDNEDDQRHLHSLVLDQMVRSTRGYTHPPPSRIALDRSCRVIQSVAHSHPWQEFFIYDPKQGRLFNRKTQTWPLFAHGNGGTDISWLTEPTR